MPEFRIAGNHLKYRALSWSLEILLMVLAALIFVLGVQGRLSDPVANWLAVPAFIAWVFGLFYLAVREAANYAWRQMVFIVDEHQIARKRRGYPDVRIAFSEIATLNEGKGHLVSTSFAPLRRIVIPKSVSGYDSIRAELAKHHAISTSPQRFPLKSIWFPLASVLSWLAVVSVHDLRMVVLFAAIALVLLVITSYYVWGLFRRIQKRSLALVSLGSAWVAAVVLIYERVMHP